VTTFAALGVPAPLLAHLEEQGISTPTPIQAATLPDLFAGHDLCGGAPTGSGKTLAFGLPLVARLGRARPHHPRAVVLAPTRELAGQIHDVIASLATRAGLRVAAVYGGVGFNPQVRALRNGVEILVACPGRLEDLMSQGIVQLDDVEAVVVDEADRMSDMGFLPAVVRILGHTPATRQTILFSATLDKAVDKLIRNHLPRARRHVIAVSKDDTARTTHLFWSTDREKRTDVCAQVIRTAGRTIVFTRTKHGADRLARQLDRLGVPAAPIHGNRSQSQRERALAQFHAGHVTALVATDVAARGIHVDDVGCVVHFDPPATGADYLHRSGRTARAGASGVVLCLVHNEVRSDVRSLLRDLGRTDPVTSPDMGRIPEGETPTPVPLPPSHAEVSARQATRPGGRGGGRGPRRPGGGDGRRSGSGSSDGRRSAGWSASGERASSGERAGTGRASGGRAAGGRSTGGRDGGRSATSRPRAR
jgi:superfamily II DNA/RNA helicase